MIGASRETHRAALVGPAGPWRHRHVADAASACRGTAGPVRPPTAWHAATPKIPPVSSLVAVADVTDDSGLNVRIGSGGQGRHDATTQDPPRPARDDPAGPGPGHAPRCARPRRAARHFPRNRDVLPVPKRLNGKRTRSWTGLAMSAASTTGSTSARSPGTRPQSRDRRTGAAGRRSCVLTEIMASSCASRQSAARSRRGAP